ncbi:hypothetical protein K431DRAFT_332974 [Polychaeton citri CBS 116435]|uniref:Uncharacterized protein n=1 Tax=Polychaeton citri CBS 116435 TaxID=1314669 RepID=A0A9P4Q0D3_9PEZI|nr:hypothetical protein K431DRAFT_332974 [Polychaeton citri CBS 116435]
MENDTNNGSILFAWFSHGQIKPTSVDRPIELDIGQAPIYNYFHINLVSRNSNNKYLIGLRHTSAVYKVSEIDGSIIKTLNNEPRSSFKVVDFILWGAHHAQWPVKPNAYHINNIQQQVR